MPGAREIIPMLIATSFAAGLNVYATVATLGILARTGALTLPPGLHLVGSWPVIAVAIALFVVEFFADKIPAFDLLWNALHTFVRVPVAAVLAYGATSNLSPAAQLGSALMGGAIALAAHGGKTAARAAVTPSPEPLSNIGLSAGEDVISIFLVWFATQHPFIAAGIALVLVVLTVVAIRLVIKALLRLFLGARREIDDLTHAV
jgi:hypothetical protein